MNCDTNNLVSSADLCGNRVLGMNNSLSEYIKTGKNVPCDAFVPKKPVEKEQPVKKQNKFLKILPPVIASVGVIGGAIFCFKKGYFKKAYNSLKDAMNVLKNKVKDCVKNKKAKAPKRAINNKKPKPVCNPSSRKKPNNKKAGALKNPFKKFKTAFSDFFKNKFKKAN